MTFLSSNNAEPWHSSPVTLSKILSRLDVAKELVSIGGEVMFIDSLPRQQGHQNKWWISQPQKTNWVLFGQ